MFSTTEIRITAQPQSATRCVFEVDRPVYPDRAFYFRDAQAAQGSPLAEQLFALEGVRGVLISHNVVTVTQTGQFEWPVLGRQIGQVIRGVLQSGQAAVSDEVRRQVLPEDELRQRVEQVLATEINPAVAAHGGVVRLVAVRDNNVYLQFGGGCQGCGMADVTLRHGVETTLRHQVSGLGDVLDVTDHAAGRNPYYAAAHG